MFELEEEKGTYTAATCSSARNWSARARRCHRRSSARRDAKDAAMAAVIEKRQRIKRAGWFS